MTIDADVTLDGEGRATVRLTEPITMPPAQAELEAAARLIVEKLPRYIADYAYEIAYVSNRQPLWTVVAGHMLRAYESGTMTAPILDPSWSRDFGTVGISLSDTRYLCDWCHSVFTPTRYKQRYCSQVCGAHAAVKQAEDERAAAAAKANRGA